MQDNFTTRNADIEECKDRPLNENYTDSHIDFTPKVSLSFSDTSTMKLANFTKKDIKNTLGLKILLAIVVGVVLPILTTLVCLVLNLASEVSEIKMGISQHDFRITQISKNLEEAKKNLEEAQILLSGRELSVIKNNQILTIQVSLEVNKFSAQFLDKACWYTQVVIPVTCNAKKTYFKLDSTKIENIFFTKDSLLISFKAIIPSSFIISAGDILLVKIGYGPSNSVLSRCFNENDIKG
jgi:hypothetical protein